jgi:hypothetical protein
MIVIKSEEIATTNITNFNNKLKELASRNDYGIEYYEIRYSTIIEYNPTNNKFYHYVEYYDACYIYHLLGRMIYLTEQEENDLYEEVSMGLVDIYIVNSITQDSNRINYGKIENFNSK